MSIPKRCQECENAGSWACDTKLTDEEVANCLFHEPLQRCELENINFNFKLGRMARPRYKAKLLEQARALRMGKIVDEFDAVEALELKVA